MRETNANGRDAKPGTARRPGHGAGMAPVCAVSIASAGYFMRKGKHPRRERGATQGGGLLFLAAGREVTGFR